jgi:hypothetical protein
MSVRKARSRARALVEQTGNEYAYEFVETRRGLVEVRALKGGRTTYTPVDAQGRPTGRAYALPTPNRTSMVSVGVAVAAIAGFVAELVFS